MRKFASDCEKTSAQNCGSSSLIVRESFVEGWEENQCFSLNSQPAALISRGWFSRFTLRCSRLQVGFPNRYLLNLRRLSRSEKMAGLNWKSETAATVVRPLQKGTGDPPKRHQRGDFKKPGSIFDPGFWFIETPILKRAVIPNPACGMRDFTPLRMTF